MALLLTHSHIYTPESIGAGSVLVDGGRIEAIYRLGEALPEVETLDLGGASLGPGFIDVHTHGGDGVELMDAGDAPIRMARFYARHGVTGFLPATLTASLDAISRAVDSARRAMAVDTGGARVLGVHLEGPFVSAQRLGAQSPDFCIPPTQTNLDRLLDATADVARIVTMAPEVEGGLEAVRRFTERGIVVSVGHTVATAAIALAAFAAGACEATHLFNGMEALHHREPGVVGAVLTTKGVRAEIIADGVHLAPMTVRLVVAAKGLDDVLLITDSMAAAGCADGEYLLGPMQVIVRNGEARLPSGNLAGSTLTLDRAVVNVARWTDAGLAGAWRMASLNPARQLRLDTRLGRVAPGYDVDLTYMNDRGEIVMTMVGGRVVFHA